MTKVSCVNMARGDSCHVSRETFIKEKRIYEEIHTIKRAEHERYTGSYDIGTD